MRRIIHFCTSADSNPSGRQTFFLVMLLLLLLALLYLPLLNQPQFTYEEPRRALIAQSMVESGNYWAPIMRDQVYTAKPPFYNWVLVLANWPGKTFERFNSRLVSVVSLGLLVATMVVGFRRQLPARSLVFLGFALALAPELANKALMAEIESLFTMLVTISIWYWFWMDSRGKRGLERWLPPAILVGIALLTKREPAIVFYYLSIGGYLLFSRRLGELFHWTHLLSAAVTAIIMGTWLWNVIAAVGYDTFVSHTLEEVVTRGTGAGAGDLLLNVLRYPAHILLALFPFSLLILPLVHREIRIKVFTRYPEIARFVTIAVLINLPLYLFRSGLAVRYFMPMMPTLLVMAALVYDVLMTERSRLGEIWTKAIARLAVILALLVAVATILLFIPEYWGLGERPPDLLPPALVYTLSIASLIATVILLRAAWRAGRSYLLIALIALMLGARILYLDVLLPHRAANLERIEDFEGLAKTILDTVPEESLPVRVYGPSPNHIWLYMGYGNLITADQAKVENLGPAEYLIAYRKVLEALRADGMRTQEIAFVPYGRGDLVFARVIGQ